MSFCARNDKPSPHSSPRLSRKIVNTNVTSSSSSIVSSTQSQNDIYASHSSFSNQSSSISMHNINGSHTNSSLQNNAPSSSRIDAKGNPLQNRMSAPSASTSSSSSSSIGMGKILNKAFSAESPQNNSTSHHDPVAPPLPPRKSSPGIENFNRFLKPNINTTSTTANQSVSSASSLLNLTNSSNMTASTLSRSTENMTFCDFEVPKSNPPPIPKHQARNLEALIMKTSELDISRNDYDLDDDKIIVGPAETISGIIDTRPLESRKPIIVQSNSDKSNSNNVYQFKTGQQNATQVTNNNRTTNQSASSSSSTALVAERSSSQYNRAITPVQKSTNFHNGQQKLVCPSSSSSTTTLIGKPQAQLPLQLYENVTIATNSKDCNVPYENINLEYISRLMNEGYSKENVITALGISKNDIEMACDILHEFASKNGA